MSEILLLQEFNIEEEELQRLKLITKGEIKDASEAMGEQLILRMGKDGLSLEGNGQAICGDFARLKKRMAYHNISHELVVKAAKIKNAQEPVRVIDATAGMGEDAFLLAAAGFQVDMYERDPVMAALLRDTLRRAGLDEELKEATSRLSLHEADSIEVLNKLKRPVDVVLLDPMFPERKKSAAVKKKFQVIHFIENPCEDEEELFAAAEAASPLRIIVKRPAKGPYLAGKIPSHSIGGKAVRYDVYVYCR